MALASGAAAGPIELVESANGNSLSVKSMDYVRAGQIIRLGPHDTIEL
jgi:hypothetical protein